MTQAIKIGDQVEWDRVPHAALGRCVMGRELSYVLRREDRGAWVDAGTEWASWPAGGQWSWGDADETGVRVADPPAPLAGRVTIVALDLTGDETAEDLRRIAGEYEIVEVLRAMSPTDLLSVTGIDPDPAATTYTPEGAGRQLYALGWRPRDPTSSAVALLHGGAP